MKNLFHFISLLFLFNIFNSYCYSDNVNYVAVGSGSNTIATSIDGNAWIGRGNTVFGTGYSVATDNTKWVAVGVSLNSIAYSTDGINWTGLGSSIFYMGQSIAYNGGMWVAVGNGTNSIAYSYDGINWTGLGTSIFTYGYSITCDGNMWVATGTGSNSIAYSYDGINWTGLGTGIFNYGYSAKSNGNMWVSVGYGSNSIAYSYDGINWTGLGNTLLTYGSDVEWNGNKWVIVGGGQYSAANSTDGITWTAEPRYFTQGYAVIWNGYYWIASGSSSNYAYTSSDGMLWDPNLDLKIDQFRDLAIKEIIPDTIPPVISCNLGDHTVSATSGSSAQISNYMYFLTYSDDVTPNENIEISQVPEPYIYFTGSQLVTLTATDLAGNSSSCSFIVTIDVPDTTPPTVICPNDTTVYASSGIYAELPDFRSLSIITDNESSLENIEIVQTPAPGQMISYGQTVTISATDEEENSANCSFLVTVDIPPLVGGEISTTMQNLTSETYPIIIDNEIAASGGTGGYNYSWEFSQDSINWFTYPFINSLSVSVDAFYTDSWVRRKVTDSYLNVAYSNVLFFPLFRYITQPAEEVIICEGESITLTVETINADDDLEYVWQIRDPSNTNNPWTNLENSNSNIYTFSAEYSFNGYNVRCQASSGGNAIISELVNLTVLRTAGITQQPTDQKTCATITLNILTEGDNISYQWQKRNNGSTNWEDISGATSHYYNYIQTTDTVFYRCRLTGSCEPIYSNEITGTLEITPYIVNAPSAQTVCLGEQATFLLQYEGDIHGVQWLKLIGNTQVTPEIGEMTVTTTSEYSQLVVDSDLSEDGVHYYYLMLGCNNELVATGAATIYINRLPDMIDMIPNKYNFWEYETLILTAIADVPILTYQWQVSPDGNANTFSDMGSEYTSQTLNQFATMDRSGNYYRCMFSTSCGDSLFTSAFPFGIRPLPQIISQTTDTVICDSEQIEISVNVSGEELTYQWYNCADQINWAVIDGATSSTYLVSLPYGNTEYYKCITTSWGEKTVTSQPISVTSKQMPAIIEHPSNVSYLCPGDIVHFQVDAIGDDILYQWQLSEDYSVSWTDIDGANVSQYEFISLGDDSGNKYRCNIISPYCSSIFSNEAELFLYPNTTISYQPIDITCCENGAGVFSANVSGEYCKSTWQISKDNGNTWETLYGESETNLIIENATQNMNGYQYRFVVNYEHLFPVYSNSATLTVVDSPHIIEQPSDIFAANGENISLSMSTDISEGVFYHWMTSSNGTSWNTITGADSTTYSMTATLEDDGKLYKGYATLVTSNHVCDEFTREVSINVTSQPAIPLMPDIEYSNGYTTLILNTPNVPNVKYYWQPDGNGELLTDVEQRKLFYSDTILYLRARNIQSPYLWSEPLLVNVNIYLDLVGGTISPSSITIQSGDSPGLISSTELAQYGNEVYSYLWQSSYDLGETWQDIEGATNVSYSPSAIDSTTWFRRKVTDGINNIEYSNNCIVTVGLVGGMISPNYKEISSGMTSGLISNLASASNGSGGYNYQWQSSLDNKLWDDILNQTGLTYSSDTLDKTTWYRRKVTDSSSNIAVTNTSEINVLLDGGNITCDVAQVESGSTPGLLSNIVSARGGIVNYHYQWQYSHDGNSWTNFLGANDEDLFSPVISQKTWYRRKVSDEVNNVAYSNIAVVDTTSSSTPLPNDVTPPAESGNVVGTIDGSINVGPTGNAVYEVPIKVPQGTGGMTPGLSIVYNSQGGNGLLGVGWSISGLSSISRAPSTLYHDGVVKEVKLDLSDKFTLDGQRLILVNGTYGADGSEYRTENNSFSRIIAYGSAANDGPEKFKVWTKSGLIKEYGYTDDSRIEARNRGAVLYWQLNKISDTKGNYIKISYDEENTNGEFQPISIEYTGNDNTGLTPYCTIDFVYETRSDQTTLYLSGVLSTITKRLTEIRCSYDNQLLKKYSLSYIYTGEGNRSHLTSLQEYGKNGSYLNQTTFSWDISTPSLNLDTGYDTYYNHFRESRFYTGDFDGDGRTDVLTTPDSDSPDVEGFRCYYAKEDGTGLSRYFVNTEVRDFRDVFVGDFNGDGISDALIKIVEPVDRDDYLYELFVGGADHTFTKKSQFITDRDPDKHMFVGDFNGDGISDIYYRNDDANSNQFKFGNQFGIFSNYSHDFDKDLKIIPFGDFNGDGCTDFINIGETKSDIYLTQSYDSNGYLIPNLYWKAQTYEINSNHIVQYGDFNADGKTDILRLGETSSPPANWGMLLSTGTSLNFHTIAAPYDVRDDYPIAGDFNADGRTDILVVEGEDNNDANDIGHKLYTANLAGNGFIESTPSANLSLHTGSLEHYLGDFTGDGGMDIFEANKDEYSTGFKLFSSGRQIQDLVTEITDGFGSTTEIDYKPLTDDNVYEKTSTVYNYPLSSFEAPMFVVSSVKTDNGIGGNFTSEYFYKDAVVHKKGKGFMGFMEVTTTDMQSGIKTTNFFNCVNSYYQTNLVKTEQRLEDNTLISETTNDYSYKTEGTRIYFPYINESVSKQYELDGSLYNTTTTNYSYDYYGNATTISIDYNGIANDATSNSYNNIITADNWFLGRLYRASVTKTRTGESSVTRVSAFEYDPTSGLLTKEIVEPDNSTYRYEKIYEHDDFGNIEKSILRRSGMNDRVTETVYDTKGRLDLETTNPLGFKTTKLFDEASGNVTYLTDPNGFVTQYQYDDFNRLIKTIAPDGNVVANAVRWASGMADAPAGALYYTWAQASGSTESIEFFDKLGRSLRKVAVGFDGSKIYVDASYNNKGQAYLITDPYFAGTSSVSTTTAYDVLGRVTSVTLPGNRITSTDYDGFTTTVTGPLNRKSIKTTDVLGKLIKSEDDYGNYVSYNYYSSGLLKETIAPGNAYTITAEYDLLGNQTKLNDPNFGEVNYEYNVYGELKKQSTIKDNVLQLTSMEYDDLGRLITRVSPEGTTNWIYDEQYKGMLSEVSAPDGINKSFHYDENGRLKQQSETVGGVTYHTAFVYDELGRVTKQYYPSGFAIDNSYNSYGFLSEVKRSSDGKSLWKALSMNARGQFEQTRYNNSLTNVRSYNSQTGRLESIVTGSLQNIGLDWNERGNLIERSDNLSSRNLIETFDYDNLDRLRYIYHSGQSSEIRYDALGNITYKYDAGDYDYNSGRPNAVDGITNNPGTISAEDQVIHYSSFNKVIDISEDANRVEFVYGPDYSRKIIKKYVDNTLVSTKKYLGLFEIEEINGVVKKTHYINGGDGLIAIFTEEDNQADKLQFVLKDHLGSIHCLVNESNTVDEEYSFDAWGRRRNPANWTYTGISNPQTTVRGFTGHEHIDLAALVNMNGRIYDPILGRFLSADPFMQAPGYTQGLNRYSYCLNNPLSLIDPSGYTWLSKNWRSVVSTALTIGVAIIAAPLAPALAGAISGFVGGFSGALLSGENVINAFKAGIMGATIGALSAGASDLIGDAAQIASNGGKLNFGKELIRSVAHGGVGGLSRLAQGGKFKHGFLSGMFSSLAGSATSTKFGGKLLKTKGARLTAAIVVGGTAEELGGGKFANGAVTGAFVMLFNHMRHEGEQKTENGKDTPWLDYAKKEYNRGIAEIKGDDLNNPRIVEYLENAGLSGNYLKDETAWCAAFADWCFSQSGIDGAGALGSNWKTWGQGINGPAYGAIAVFKTNHIGFVVGQKGDNLIILHGNWSNKISLSDYIKPSEIDCYRFPTGYNPKKFP